MLKFAARQYIRSSFARALPQLKILVRNKSDGMLVLNEIQGNLFKASKDYSLVNCVAADFKMSSGIAAQFKEVFGQVDDLKDQEVKPGGVAVLKDDDRFIYYLVTKQCSHEKPSYDTVKSSLMAMKKHMAANNVHKLAMPRIGSGIDGLKWSEVKHHITDVFGFDYVCIIVYYM